jgi:hypothetical protein
VTKLEHNYPGIEKTDSMSKYGTLMKIYKENISDFNVNDKIRIYKLNITGITFARFKIINLTKKDSYYVANIEIISDDIPKDVEQSINSHKLI